MDKEEYRVHQSHLSSWEKEGSCKLKMYKQDILQEVWASPPSEQMIKGTYFETKCLGRNVGSDSLPDIPFLYDSKGKERIELKRLNEQVKRFKELFDPNHKDFLGYSIKDTQVFLKGKYSEGTIDFTATDRLNRPAIFDLKFTADVDSTFGDYSWGRDPYDIDWTQLVVYRGLYKANFGVDPRTLLIAFDSSPKKGIRLFDVKISDSTEEIVLDRIYLMYSEVNGYIDTNTDPKVNPSEKECSDCSVDCAFRFKPGVIKKTIVNV